MFAVEPVLARFMGAAALPQPHIPHIRCIHMGNLGNLGTIIVQHLCMRVSAELTLPLAFTSIYPAAEEPSAEIICLYH